MVKKEVLLEIKNLVVEFKTESEKIRAVNDISFTLRQGETIGIVGESGCGKTMTALSLMRLMPSPPARIVSGRIMFDGQDIGALGEAQLRELRLGAAHAAGPGQDVVARPDPRAVQGPGRADPVR